MFDTMTITKGLGAVCGSLLVFLLLNWAADGVYSMSGGGHGGEEEAQAYSVAVEDAAGGGEAVAEGPAFAEVYAAADAAKGEKGFSKCKACHKIDGGDSTGPHLNGVVDRGIASVAGFGYSDALKAYGAGKTWTADELNLWVESPKTHVPGNKMSFAGLPKVEDRANLIAYLATLK